MIGFNARTCPQCTQALRPSALFCPHCGTAVLPSVSNALQVSLKQILAGVKPGQAEVMRRCAIPRWFDAEIMAVLRDRQDGNNEKILSQLETYSFVRRLSAERYTYSDDVRHVLLEDWRQRPDDLRPIQKRLYNYFERRMGATNTENRATWLREIVTYDLLLASTTLVKDQQGSSSPWIITAGAVAARLERAVLRFRSLFEAAFQAHRMAEAEAILVAVEEQANILAPSIQDWVVYYRGKLCHATLQLAQAITNYQQLLNRRELDPELRTLSTISLGDVQVENGSWAAAINSYQAALALPRLESGQRAAVHLGIADAYNEIAISSGGWHIANQPKNPLLRFTIRATLVLASLPMLILVWFLHRLGAAVPPALVLVRYQNWLLARIFRASRDEIQAAYIIYKERDDPINIARCEMRLVDIDVLFGNTRQAVELAQQLINHIKPEDTYRRAKLQLTLARALFANNQGAAAQQQAEEALVIFRAVDDGRWETRALSVLGRIYAAEGKTTQAIDMYQQGLTRALAINSVLSRERILYELRIWRRINPKYPPVLDTILSNVPSQRFVSRFPSFLLPYLQIGQSVVIPAVLLLTAVIAPRLQPSTVLRTDTNLLLPTPNVYVFPWQRLLISPIIMLLIAGVAYALLGLIVLWRMPLTRVRQNQPDIIVLHPEEMIHFDQHGDQAHRIRWADITAIVSADRKLWDRPLPVFSRTIIESNTQPILRIDGITSWYNTMSRIIRQRTRAAGANVKEHNLDFSLLHSWNGVLISIGLVLLSLMIASTNRWIPNLAEVLPATVFAVLQLLAYSGILLIIPILYWTVIRGLRLQREFGFNERFPVFIAALGFAIVLLFILTNGMLVRVPIFSISLFLTGLFLLTETSYQLSVRRGHPRALLLVRIVIQVVMLYVGFLVVAAPIKREFYRARAYAYSVQGNETAAGNDRFREVTQESVLFSPPMPLERAAAETIVGDWATAQGKYETIINDPQADALTQALAQHNMALSQLQRCSQKNTCSNAELTQIIATEDMVLATLQDPNARSAALETQGEAFFRMGDTATALAKLTLARDLAFDLEHRNQIEQRIRFIESQR